MNAATRKRLLARLDSFEIELPSWGFADTGTRFGKFLQPAAASTIDHKLEDAALCHRLTGACPSVAVHVLWDFASGIDPKAISKAAAEQGVRIGSINPNVFEDQAYKLGSVCNPDPKVRKQALDHLLECVEIARKVKSNIISLWFADGTNYPGQDNLRNRKRHMEQALQRLHEAMPPRMRMLVEYKPFEPAFYHTDIPDWGMAMLLAQKAGKRAQVLVDTGHHLPGCNIEQIVAILLDENMLGGFHFNDRKYADDDLTLGSIDPYAAFRIFNAIAQHAHDTGKAPKIEYMVDQSHNLKPKIEAMLQTVEQAQKMMLRAELVDRKKLAAAQKKGDILTAERLLMDAFEANVMDVLAEWRAARDLPADPVAAYRDSGHQKQAGKARSAGRPAAASAYAS